MKHTRSGVMMRQTLMLICVALGMVIGLPAQPVRAGDLVTVEAFQWTDSVNRSTRHYNKRLSSPVRTKELYLWVQLKGSPELLEKLRQTPGGTYMIRHEWYRYGVDRVSSDLNVGISLSVGREKDLDKLAYEVDAKGAFYWRVWSGKRHLSRGWWRVDIVDANGDIVHYTDNGITKPCSFDIKVH